MRFVTVVYPPELEMLHLQARSFDLFVIPQDVTEIAVITMGCHHRDVAPEAYGVHADKVSIVPAVSVCGNFGAGGYVYQQMLKLAIHRVFGDQPYMVLDAKNFFIRTFQPDEYFAGGKPYLQLLKYSPDNMGALAASEYRGFRGERVRPYEPSILTPQIFLPEVVRETLRRFHLENMPHMVTCSEFMAYGMTALDMNAHRPTMKRFVHLLRGDNDVRLHELFDTFAPMAGVHRLFYEKASVNQMRTFGAYLKTLGLK